MSDETLLYIHGFLSSPQSYKAQKTKEWLAECHPEIRFVAPELSPYPFDVRDTLTQIVEGLVGRVYLMGSSLGGFWSTYLAERYDLPAVLINPACEPHKLLPRYVGQTVQNYHSEQSYHLSQQHVDELAEIGAAPMTKPENYWLMAQTGDETLDYRLAVAKYAGARQLVEEGGNHGFEHFERHLPATVSFYREFFQKG